MAMVEREIVQRLGEDWLDNGRTKTIGFQILRLGVDISPPDAVIIGTAINSFKATAKLRAQPVRSRGRCSTRNHDRHHEAVAEGLLEVCDALLVSVQTPEKMLLYTQDFDRGGRAALPTCSYGRRTSRWPAKDLGGQAPLNGTLAQHGRIAAMGTSRHQPAVCPH